MLVLSAFSRVLVALAVLFGVAAASLAPASARSHHGAYRATHARYAYHHVRRQFVQPGYRAQAWYPQAAFYPRAASYPQVSHRAQVAYRPRLERHVALTRLRRFAAARPHVAPETATSGMAAAGSSSSLVMEARHYLGTNPTSRGSLWCARFMNMVLEKTGHHGTGSDMASSFASYGHRVSGPEVGAIAVMGRRGGGHVGIITGIDTAGNPIMISGNNGNRVREAPISRGRIYAYVMPN
jgi:uncharacterized protein (TIGR02594 family)